MNDFLSFFVDFYDKPDKTRQFFFSLVRVFLVAMFSDCCYRYFFGNYHLLSLLDFEALYHFIISGRWLLVGIVVTSASFLLLGVLPFLFSLTARALNFIKVKKDDHGLFGGVNAFLVFANMMGKPAVETDTFVWVENSGRIMELLEEGINDGKEKMNDYKDAFLSDRLYLMLLVTCSYFFYAPVKPPSFSITLVTLCVGMALFYFYLYWIIEKAAFAIRPYYNLFYLMKVRYLIDEIFRNME